MSPAAATFTAFARPMPATWRSSARGGRGPRPLSRSAGCRGRSDPQAAHPVRRRARRGARVPDASNGRRRRPAAARQGEHRGGGHLNPVDEGDDALMTGLRREWSEELEADWEPEFRLIGLLNDDSNPVGAVHLGVVFSVRGRRARGRRSRARQARRRLRRRPMSWRQAGTAWRPGRASWPTRSGSGRLVPSGIRRPPTYTQSMLRRALAALAWRWESSVWRLRPPPTADEIAQHRADRRHRPGQRRVHRGGAAGRGRGGDRGRAIIVIDSPGGELTSMDRIIKAILGSEVPVIAWVAPEGARAASAATFVTLAADVAAMAPNTNIGAASVVGSGGEELPETLAGKVTNDAVARIRSLAERAWAQRGLGRVGRARGRQRQRHRGRRHGAAGRRPDRRRSARPARGHRHRRARRRDAYTFNGEPLPAADRPAGARDRR